MSTTEVAASGSTAIRPFQIGFAESELRLQVASEVAAARAKGLPSESRQMAQRSPGWMTEPPSA